MIFYLLTCCWAENTTKTWVGPWKMFELNKLKQLFSLAAAVADFSPKLGQHHWWENKEASKQSCVKFKRLCKLQPYSPVVCKKCGEGGQACKDFLLLLVPRVGLSTATMQMLDQGCLTFIRHATGSGLNPDVPADLKLQVRGKEAYTAPYHWVVMFQYKMTSGCPKLANHCPSTKKAYNAIIYESISNYAIFKTCTNKDTYSPECLMKRPCRI